MPRRALGVDCGRSGEGGADWARLVRHREPRSGGDRRSGRRLRVVVNVGRTVGQCGAAPPRKVLGGRALVLAYGLRPVRGIECRAGAAERGYSPRSARGCAGLPRGTRRSPTCARAPALWRKSASCLGYQARGANADSSARRSRAWRTDGLPASGPRARGEGRASAGSMRTLWRSAASRYDIRSLRSGSRAAPVSHLSVHVKL